MATLDSFHSLVLPSVIGCPTVTANQAIVNACIEFCEKTLIVREVIDPFDTVADTQDYDIDVSIGSKLVMIMQASIDGIELVPLGSDDFLSLGTAVSKPQSYRYREDGTLALYPIPDDVYAVGMVVATKPSRAATTVNDKLFEDWGEHIASGALQRLLMIPAVWSNPALAASHASYFMAGINKARLDHRREKTRAETSIRPVWI